MKASIHPQYFDDAKVVCSCGNTFNVGSTKQNIHVELCYKCHPFYTGTARFVDSASRIEKFKLKQDTATQNFVSKKKKQDEKRQAEQQPQTLREMLQALKR
jgi:large subunit ribosomal protein L31